MTCAYADWDGSYVLGGLSPADRDEFERHLADCPTCAAAVRGLAGLPGLLSRVDERALTESPEQAPDTLLPRLVREVRRERRRHGLLAAGLAAAAVASVVAGTMAVDALTGPDSPTAAPAPVRSATVGASPGTTEPGPAARAMEPVADAPVTGWLTLEAVPWGTRLTLQCTYEAAADGYGGAGPTGYVMVVRTRDGGEQEVATWNAVPGRSMQLAAATAVGQADITAVEVRTDAGSPVLRLPG